MTKQQLLERLRKLAERCQTIEIYGHETHDPIFSNLAEDILNICKEIENKGKGKLK